MLRQLSVFIENNQGSLADLTQALESKGIMIHAIALADASRFGVVRAVVSKPDLALKALQEAGYSGCLTEVVGVKADEAAGLSRALKALSEHAIDIEYLYVLKIRDGARTLVLGVPDSARSEAALSEAGFVCAGEEDLDEPAEA